MDLTPQSPEVREANRRALALIAGYLGMEHLAEKERGPRATSLVSEAITGRSDVEAAALVHVMGEISAVLALLASPDGDPMDMLASIETARRSPDSSGF